jgi:hypothetical protein
MAKMVTLQDSFDGGVKRDSRRDKMPKGALWWAEDVLPVLSYNGQSAGLRERGGYSFFSADLSSTVATTQYVIAGIVPPSWSGLHVIVDEDGRVIKLDTAGVVTDVAAGNVVSQNPVLHRDKVILPGSTPKKVTNSAGTFTVASLAGSPPASTYAAVFNDRTLLARGTSTNLNRLWFSDPGDPEGWDTTNSYWDFSYDITGLASLKTAVLVFHDSYVSRLRGTTPPPGSDFFADDPLWSVGCADARSIAYWGDRVLFASPEGIFITDGAGVDDLTVKSGMLSWWQEQLSAYAASTYTISAGVLRDFYFISVMDGTSLKVGAMIDLRRLAWWPVTNIKARSMYGAQAAADELYFGNRDTDRVSKLSTVFMPSSTVKNDGDGTAVTGLVETPFYRGPLGGKGWRRLRLTHFLRDYATDNPTVTGGYAKTPEATSYTALSTTFAENTAEAGAWAALGFGSSGVAFQFTRANAGDWQIAGIEADVNAREGSR